MQTPKITEVGSFVKESLQEIPNLNLKQRIIFFPTNEEESYGHLLIELEVWNKAISQEKLEQNIKEYY